MSEKFRWRRSDDAWVLDRWVVDSDLNMMYWDWTGYSVSGKSGRCFIEVPRLSGYRSTMKISEAKAEVERLAKEAAK